MALFDLPLDRLSTYVPAREEPADFEEFWRRTLDETRRHPLDATFEPYECGLSLVETFDVTFRGYGGQPVKGWLLAPRHRTGKLPCVVQYIGYSGGRGFPFHWLLWANVGYLTLVMDTRGQGYNERMHGDTPDVAPEGTGPHAAGFMTMGVSSPETYYYRRLYADAVRAIEAARAFPETDGSRIAVTGKSQGGGLSVAMSGFVPDLAAVMPDVPFLCHFRRAVEITDVAPYAEIARYCRGRRDDAEQAFRTLSYFDGMQFAARATAPALFSVGLMDQICPPSTVYAAYNHYRGAKEIRIYPFNGHEGGERFFEREQIAFLQRILG